MTNEMKLSEMTERTNKIISERGVEGSMGLYINSKAWDKGEIDLMVVTQIPSKLTTKQAMEYGWALYMLGKYGGELQNEPKHEIDEDYFMD